MTPKIVDKDLKREEIAQTAMQLFVRKGFENTAIREITAAAGMSKGAFYDYFAAKEDILDEIARIMFDRWTSLYLEQIGSTRDPIQRLRAMAALTAAEAAEFESLTVMYIDLWRLGNHLEQEPPFMVRFRGFISEARQAAADLIDQAKTAGKVRPDVDSEAMAASFAAFIDGLAFHKMIYRDRMDLDRIWPPFFEAWLEGMAPVEK